MWYLHKVIYYEEIKNNILLWYMQNGLELHRNNVEQKNQTQNNGLTGFCLCKIIKGNTNL